MAGDKKKLDKDLFVLAKDKNEDREKISRPVTTFLQDAVSSIIRNIPAMVSIVALLFIVVMSFVGPGMNEFTATGQDLQKAKLPPRVEALEDISWLRMDGIERATIEAESVEEAKRLGLARFKNNEDFITFEVVEEGDGSPDSAKVKVEHEVYLAKELDDTYHWLGTDGLGRDLWTRTWEGTKISLYIAILAAIIDLVIGVAYGGISGYYGGRVDNVMQRIIEILAGIMAITLALTITGWTGMARIVRGEVLKLKNEEFVLASRTLGAPNKRIIGRHLVPNVLGLIIINTMFTIPSAIFFESFLSFIGLGLQPPDASLGTLIDDGFKSLRTYPYMLVSPAILISIIMIAFNLLGDGLRDAFDPKMRK